MLLFEKEISVFSDGHKKQEYAAYDNIIELANDKAAGTKRSRRALKYWEQMDCVIYGSS